MKKPANADGAPGPNPSDWPCGEDLVKKFPNLVEFLAVQVWEDGSARATGTATLCLVEGRISLALNDRALSRSCFVSAASIEKVLAAAEKAITGYSGDWRRKREWEGSKKARKG